MRTIPPCLKNPLLFTALLGLLFGSCKVHRDNDSEREPGEKEDIAFTIRQEFLQEFEKTKDPTTNTVPRERLLDGSAFVQQYFTGRQSAISGISWQERGPNNVGGRTRAILFDKNDVTHNTIFAGGVAGGIWKCSNLSSSPPTWVKISDILDNIAISCIVQDQLNPSIMYFGTGEIWGNLDAQRGLGIWKSTDGGTSWNHLSSTTSNQFNYIQNIILTPSAVFAATGSGLKKSTDGGNSWATVLIDAMSDVQLAANGDIYASNFLGNVYKSTSVQQGNTGTWANVSVPGSHERLKLATAPSDASKVYAICQQAGGNDVDAIYRTDDGGANWVSCAVPTIIDQGNNSNFTRGQAWYDLAAVVDPNDASTVIIGGVDALRSTDGGTTWNQISTWSLFGAPSSFLATVHADQHAIVYSPGSSSKAVWGTDGGIYYTTNVNVNGSTIKPDFLNKNTGYNVTQTYAGAMDPTAGSNYFLAGAQDNGSLKFPNLGGIQNTLPASGGDGAFCHIDQAAPANQITAYVYNVYYRSTNSGGSFSNNPKINDQNHGSFINPTDFDSSTKVLYGDYSNPNTGVGGVYARWLTTGTTNTGVTVADFGTARVTNVYVSPNVADRVYFGLSGGSVVYVNNASTATTGTVTSMIIKTGIGSVSGIAIEPGNENHILVTYSNYGVTSVFETTNGGTSWINDEGNLPDMPVRWVVFNPLNYDQALLATELGVWSTDNLNGTSTLWAPTNPGLANTRVDMLKVRRSDNTILAATHGRGLFTTTLTNSVLPSVYFEKSGASVPENGGGGTSCSPGTSVVPVKLYLTSAATAPVTVQVAGTPSSTATSGSDFSIGTPSVTFPTGTTGPQTVNVTISDDKSFEGNEYISLGYTITSGGAAATAGTTLQHYEIEIADDEVAASGGFTNIVTSGPVTTNLGASSPVQGTQTDKKSQYLYLASELLSNGLKAGTITDISFAVKTKASSAPFKGFTFKVGATAATSLSGFITPSSWKVITSGDYDTKFGNNDFSIPGGFVWNGTSNLVFEFCYNNSTASADDIIDGEGTTYNSQAKKSSTVPSDDGCSYASTTTTNTFRPVFTFTQTIPQTSISTSLSSSQAKFSAADNVYFYDGSGKIIASIQNQNSLDYGCTSVTIDRAGTGASPFVFVGAANYLMNKTFRVIPGTYHANGVYTITLYYTAAEKAGWEAATGNLWSNILLVKTSGAISSATPVNPGGSGSIETVTPVRGTFGTDYTLSYTFNDGFSGFGAGIIASTLPVGLLDFDGVKQHSGVLLKWKTENEINTSYYEVQRSSNGRDYESIGNVKSFGLTGGGSSYSLVDSKAGIVNYYRLKITDYDGAFTYSKIVSVNIPGLGQKIYVLNNPFSNAIRLRFGNQPKDKVSLRLVDPAGKVLVAKEFRDVGNTLELNLPSRYTSRGIYILEAVVDGSRFVYKLVKDQ